MKWLFGVFCGFFAAVFLAMVFTLFKKEKATDEHMIQVTRFLFITTQLAALGWVSVSYVIALYATVRLGQVFPVIELSQQAISTILGTSALKVLENIFEHNNGGIWGNSK